MRDGFRDTVSGWALTDDVEGLGEYIEASAHWVKENGGGAAMEPDEHATVRMMIAEQVRRGIRRGDFESLISSDIDDATLRDLLNSFPDREL